MQTFLPYADFMQSARCLDMKRLGKQRLEVIGLLKANLNGGGWVNHPAAKMWRGSEVTLCEYGLVICYEWKLRGYKDTCTEKILEYSDRLPYVSYLPKLPTWLGDAEFHRSHQSNLLRKKPEHYSQFGWDVPTDLPYVWPVNA